MRKTTLARPPRPPSETLAELQKWVSGLGSNCAVELDHPQPLDSGSGAGMTTVPCSARQTHPFAMPAKGDLCTTVIPAQAGIQDWGSPLGMLAISATLSPTGGVTQRSPDAGIYPRQGAPTRLWTQSITLAVPITSRIWARGVRFDGQPVTERHRAGETCGAFPVESGDKNLRLRYDGMEWKCEKCGNINPPTRSVFCGKCGKRRDEG